MIENKVYQMISLAQKAGKITAGEEMAEREIKDNKSKLVIVATDSSQNTIKRFTDRCTFRHVPMFIFGTKEELGQHIGKQFRAVLSVHDKGLAAAIIKLLEM
ncbi:MAG: ribosomal L7Ae/L30e/S12e/Gadd45 family protein [Hyphomonadaceae bacterium]|nr:ribosomal L7Ae/L30e/S12e/Gadd45 family protein [Clostridia bacterium]